MSLQSTFSSTIHLRDFVDTVTEDPSRENAPNYVEIQTDVNIFEESSFYSPNVNVEPIHTRIHAYLTREERDLYVVNTFFYADGRFSTALHPGDVSDFDKYRRHLPEQWCPMVTIIGFVPSRSDKTLDFSEDRCFAAETCVYDTSKAAPVAFSVTCFLETTKRCITAKVAGRTTDTNQLALRVLDLAYLPRPAAVPTATPTPSSTPTSKRSARWEGRATPFTPSKRRRGSDSASLAGSSYKNQLPQSTEGRSHVSISEDSPDSPANSPSNSPSPSTMANTGESSITLHPFPGSDRETRPHRNRHPPKKYPHKE
ncbi:hypothetical protein FOFC_15818 [Fusarium oxysporum]|nr:hypothetical protein FocnCong_v020917 [Fusarium oxysporum f. sp. conglutinans]KAI8404323.1 hypothetical protein FOFC_15818 [Fusarium oxysporum]